MQVNRERRNGTFFGTEYPATWWYVVCDQSLAVILKTYSAALRQQTSGLHSRLLLLAVCYVL